MITSFEELVVYQLSRELRRRVWMLTKTLPQEERFVLLPPMRRAALSVTNNIAEGFGRYHFQENVQSPNHSSSQRGFTLVELTLVIALLGLVLAIVLPRIGVAATAAAASRQLVGMMHALYLAAPATQKIHRLYLDLDQRSYWAMAVDSEGERPPTDPALTRRVTLPQDVRFRDAMTASQGKIAVGRAIIQFYPTGRTDRSVVHLSDDNQTTLTLVLNPVIGSVQILDGYKDPSPVQPVPEQYRPFLFPGLTTTRT